MGPRQVKEGTSHISKAKREDNDYTFHKKLIWKGKMAPKGSIFLVVRAKTLKGKSWSVRQLPTGLKDEVSKLVAKEMFGTLKEKGYA